jgi:hypothetical protein
MWLRNWKKIGQGPVCDAPVVPAVVEGQGGGVEGGQEGRQDGLGMNRLEMGNGAGLGEG